MPDVRIPLKDSNGKIDPDIIPNVPRFPDSDVAAGDGKIPVTSASGWDYVDSSTMGGSGGGGAIAATRYNPATATQKTVNSTTLTNLDSGLLSVSFTAPASGKVYINLSGTVKGSAAGTRSYWALMEGGVVVDNTVVMAHEGTIPSRATASVVVEGLTGGATYTYTWAAAASTGTTTLTAGGQSVDASSAGQATIIVQESPF